MTYVERTEDGLPFEATMRLAADAVNDYLGKLGAATMTDPADQYNAVFALVMVATLQLEKSQGRGVRQQLLRNALNDDDDEPGVPS